MGLYSYFGYAPVSGFIVCWGARAIFRPLQSGHHLDLLPDRQGIQLAVEDDRHKSLSKKLCEHLNNKILKEIDEITGHFDISEDSVFVKHFPWDNEHVLVATGSPQKSYGYFYLSVSLVKKADAPAEKKPPSQILEEERLQWLQQQQQQNSVAAQKQAKIKRLQRQSTCAAIEEKVAKVPHKEEGELLEVGDHFYIDVNQGSRHAFVLAVDKNEAFAKYYMPNGREFLIVVDRDDHHKRKNISPNRIPKKWEKAI